MFKKFKIIFYVHQAILCTHDAVAQKDYYPHLPDIPPDADEEEETVKIVQLVKSDEPLVCIALYMFYLDQYSTIRNMGLLQYYNIPY